MKYPNYRKLALWLSLPCSLLILSHSTFAQEADEQVYELSPFEVDGSGDMGYMAGNTLAGTRLNSELTDVAAAISPFTREFINDIGADSIEDLLEYSNNLTRLDNTEFANDNQVIEFEFQFNVRGLPASRSRNYFAWEVISMDNFNVERVDESRGPNSILFGVGSAGGVINLTTKRARFTDINEIQFMVGSNNKLRGSVDFNRELIDGKLAVRFNAMWEEGETWRLWEFKDQRRFHFASTWKIADRTTLRVEAEEGYVLDNLARSYLGFDYTSAWIAAGRPDRSVTTSNNGNRNNNWVYRANDGAAFFSSGGNRVWYTNLGGGARELIGEESDQIQSGLLSWKANPGGPDNTRETNYLTYSAFLEHAIGDDLNFEIAFNHLENDFLQYDSLGASYDLRGDTTDPAVAPSPNSDRSGDLYYETWWGIRTRDREADTIRATGSYELELPDWWGYHRFAGMVEHLDVNAARESAFDFLADANGNLITPLAIGASEAPSRSRIYRRNYITEGDFSTYHVASWREPVSVTQNGVTYTNQWFPRNQNVQDDDLTLESLLISMQNFWLDGKFITTFGYREDTIEIDKRTVTQEPGTGRFVVDYVTPPQKFKFSGGTKTIGLVGKPTDWLSILYNKSDNRGLPDVNRLIVPNSTFADPSEGDGSDIGIMLNLFDDRVFARIAHFESSMVGLTEFGARGNVERRNNRILEVLEVNGLISQSERAERTFIANTNTFARESEGWEVEITANPTRNWSIRMNYSRNERIKYNIMPEVVAWYEEELPYWQSFGDTVYNNVGEGGPGTGPYEPLSGPSLSIAEEAEDIDNFYIQSRTAFEGIGDQGYRKDTANLFTNYRFEDGFLEGFNIGGGFRYLGPMSVAVNLAEESVVYGNQTTLYDLVLGYTMDAAFISDNATIKFQVNVRNLFDNDEHLVVGRETDGRLRRLALQVPRTIQFRTTISW
ncbi:MAG: TonB-dependent siderophore receptor [Puniceicoccaceae bacterium]